jgi:hypothetical protein
MRKITSYKGYKIFRSIEEMDKKADEIIFKVYDVYPDMRVYNKNEYVLDNDIIKYHYHNTEAIFKGIYVSPIIPEKLIPKLLKKHLGL